MTATTPPPPHLELLIPTPDDFHGMAVLQTAAFVEKQAWGESTTELTRLHHQTYVRYYKEAPVKLRHCRIIKSTNGTSVLAACQLHLRQPQTSKRNKDDDDEPKKNNVNVFIEWIACHPDCMNQGLGSRLLAWAAAFAKQELKAEMLTLYVVKANIKAVRLYKRRGFVIHDEKRRRNTCDRFAEGLLGLVCLGCDRHWTVLTMEKDLLGEEEEEVGTDLEC